LSDYESCSVCGCTDETPCIDEQGLQCAWANETTCTECAGKPAPLVRTFSAAEADRIIRAMRAEGAA
jgi:hypothetical protein